MIILEVACGVALGILLVILVLRNLDTLFVILGFAIRLLVLLTLGGSVFIVGTLLLHRFTHSWLSAAGLAFIPGFFAFVAWWMFQDWIDDKIADWYWRER